MRDPAGSPLKLGTRNARTRSVRKTSASASGFRPTSERETRIFRVPKPNHAKRPASGRETPDAIISRRPGAPWFTVPRPPWTRGCNEIPSHPGPSHPIPFHPIPSHFILFHPTSQWIKWRLYRSEGVRLRNGFSHSCGCGRVVGERGLLRSAGLLVGRCFSGYVWGRGHTGKCSP